MSLKKAFLRGEAARLAARAPVLTEDEKNSARLAALYNRHADKLAPRLDKELSEIVAKNYGLTLAQLHPRYSRPRRDAFDASITYLLFKMRYEYLPQDVNAVTVASGALETLQKICDAPHIDAWVHHTFINSGEMHNRYLELGVEITPRAPKKTAPSV